MSYEIPERHAAYLRAILRLEENDPIPQPVYDSYLEHRRIIDVIGVGFPDTELATVVRLAKGVKAPEQPPEKGAEWQRIAYNSVVAVGNRIGRFSGLKRDAKKKLVLLVTFDEGQEAFYPEAVAFKAPPEPELARAT